MTSSWAASALDWWQEAGVDTLVGETPRDWLSPPAPRAAPVEAAPRRRRPRSPTRSTGFRDWLATTADLPFAAPAARRDRPVGDPDSGLMVLVDMPSPEGGLLAGEAGALFDRMLAAIGRSRETIYLAALSPVRTADRHVRRQICAAARRVARHHIGLAAPKTLLALRRHLRQGPGRRAGRRARAASGTRSPPRTGRSRLW